MKLATVYLKAALCGFAFLLSADTQGQESNEQQLKEIQQEIQRRQLAIDKQMASAKELQQWLQQDETRIAKTAKALNQTRESLADNRNQQQDLQKQQKSLQQQLSQQQSLLAKQLRSAYMSGNHDYAKLLFNQSDAAALERSITYYQYLNKARTEQIDSFTRLGQELKQVETTLSEKQQELQQLASTQQQQQQQLAAQQQQRQQTLQALNKSIDTEAARIEQLQINEQNLQQAIERAQRQASQPATLDGLKASKGKLLRPVDGRLRRLFGLRRQGQVKWKGVMFNAREGQGVQAVHQGQVLFADWLKGFGLVIVLDHGQGYMSLYGYNQALLKQAGDMVEAGENIALVGQSGGQSSPGLYFEIRHKGQALNPSRWLGK